MASIIDQFKRHKSHFLEIGLGTGEIFEMTSTKFDFSVQMFQKGWLDERLPKD
jgi:hypothetical protein